MSGIPFAGSLATNGKYIHFQTAIHNRTGGQRVLAVAAGADMQVSVARPIGCVLSLFADQTIFLGRYGT